MKIVQAIQLFRMFIKMKKGVKGMDMSTIKGGIKTSEFWVGLSAAIVVFVIDYFALPIDPDTINNFILLVVSYIGGRSVLKGADAVTNKRKQVVFRKDVVAEEVE